jgi:hypothetical protein
MVASLDSSSQFSSTLIDDLTATVSEADAITLRGILPGIYDDLRRDAKNSGERTRLACWR